MKTHLQCIPCLLRATLNTLGVNGVLDKDPAMAERVLKEAMRITASEDWGTRPPVHVALLLNRLLHAELGVSDPWHDAKRTSNAAALAMLPSFSEKLSKLSGVPLLRSALALAAAGNVVDFSCEVKIDLGAALAAALEKPFAIDDSALLFESLASARSLLFFTDNSGEVAFDRLLLETIARLFPQLEDVAVVCKAGPLLNDVTMEDVRAVGLDKLCFGPSAKPVRFIELGDRDLGAWPPAKGMPDGMVRSEPHIEFPAVFGQFGAIISKGQANFESLCGWKAGIFFVLTVKCDVLSGELSAPVTSRVVHRI